jgi:prepilin-type N-terminal cleavage/methylation domain-containing protein
MKAVSPPAARHTSRGFTLVEIMTVVVIIGMLAALAIPAFQKVRRRAQNSATVNGFRVFSQAFEQYMSENGQWPPNVRPGQLPAALSDGASIRVNTWQAKTPIGGQWNWDAGGTAGLTAGISISNFTCDDVQLAEIDALLDDGDLTKGNVRKIGSNRLSYVLEE